MYLSRLTLNMRHRLVMRDLGDVRDLHRTIMSAFPQHDGSSPRSEFGVLFRLENDPDETQLLVQSQVEPDWEAVSLDYLAAYESRQANALLDAPTPERIFSFRLVANPTRKRSVQFDRVPHSKHSRRVALTTELEQYEWLVSRAERGGFELAGSGLYSGVRIDPLRAVASRAPKRSGIYVRPSRFEGVLQVKNPERASRSRCALGLGRQRHMVVGCSASHPSGGELCV